MIRKLFDISCISDHVQPVSKSFSVVLAECGHFVVTWSVQEYSCGHLVCAGIFLHCPVFTQACAGICLQSPFDLCACSCMSYLVGYLKPDLCKS